MTRHMNNALIPSAEKAAEYERDCFKVMTTADITDICGATANMVNKAVDRGQLINFGHSRYYIISAANVFDWIRLKWGPVFLQKCIDKWYAKNALKR